MTAQLALRLVSLGFVILSTYGQTCADLENNCPCPDEGSGRCPNPYRPAGLDGNLVCYTDSDLFTVPDGEISVVQGNTGATSMTVGSGSTARLCGSFATLTGSAAGSSVIEGGSVTLERLLGFPMSDGTSMSLSSQFSSLTVGDGSTTCVGDCQGPRATESQDANVNIELLAQSGNLALEPNTFIQAGQGDIYLRSVSASIDGKGAGLLQAGGANGIIALAPVNVDLHDLTLRSSSNIEIRTDIGYIRLSTSVTARNVQLDAGQSIFMSNIERTGGAGDIVLNARLAIFTDEDSTINAGDGSLIIRGRIVAASSNPLSPSKLTLEGNTIDVRSADGPGGLVLNSDNIVLLGGDSGGSFGVNEPLGDVASTSTLFFNPRTAVFSAASLYAPFLATAASDFTLTLTGNLDISNGMSVGDATFKSTGNIVVSGISIARTLTFDVDGAILFSGPLTADFSTFTSQGSTYYFSFASYFGTIGHYERPLYINGGDVEIRGCKLTSSGTETTTCTTSVLTLVGDTTTGKAYSGSVRAHGLALIDLYSADVVAIEDGGFLRVNDFVYIPNTNPAGRRVRRAESTNISSNNGQILCGENVVGTDPAQPTDGANGCAFIDGHACDVDADCASMNCSSEQICVPSMASAGPNRRRMRARRYARARRELQRRI